MPQTMRCKLLPFLKLASNIDPAGLLNIKPVEKPNLMRGRERLWGSSFRVVSSCYGREAILVEMTMDPASMYRQPLAMVCPDVP